MFKFKAIETMYNGYRFRSRLEARWAVFFDALGIKYEYEKEGYEMEGIRYLPDFWLPVQDCFVEIKGEEPSEEEQEKAQLLALYSQKKVSVWFGPVEIPPDDLLNSCTFMPPSLWKYKKSERIAGGTSTVQIDVPSHILAIMQGLRKHNLQLVTLPRGGIEINPYASLYDADSIDGLIEDLHTQIRGLQKFKSRIEDHLEEIKKVLILEDEWTFEFLSQTEFEDSCYWCECGRCHAIEISFHSEEHHACADGGDGKLVHNSPRLLSAYAAARSARFEFGEKGRRK